MLAAEASRIATSELGVISSAALGDVVKEPGDVEHFRPREVRDKARAQWIFVRVLGFGEASQVANHHQDVLVYGVDVKQIVLHLAYDAAEHRQVAPRIPY